MSQNGSTPNGFVGGYIKDMVNVLAAALIARQNVVLIGGPGLGKTRVALSFAHQTVGKDATSLTRLHPAAPPDVFLGAIDPIAFTQGRIARVVTGTPYDPACKLAIVDEFSRANEASFEALLDTADRLDVDDAPPVIATANFAPTGERVKALNDRFALWYYLNPGRIDAAAMSTQRLQAYSNGNPHLQADVSHLPTQSQLETIWKSDPGPNAQTAVSAFTAKLEVAAAESGFMVNPRRNSQWTDLLFRLGVWYSGMNPDFSTVPDAAAKVLIYAWPSQDATEAATWKQIALSIVDTVASAIDKTMADLLVVMEKVQQSPANKWGSIIMEAVDAMTKAEKTLKALAPDDARIAEHLDQMKVWYTKASRGEPLE